MPVSYYWKVQKENFLHLLFFYIYNDISFKKIQKDWYQWLVKQPQTRASESSRPVNEQKHDNPLAIQVENQTLGLTKNADVDETLSDTVSPMESSTDEHLGNIPVFTSS